MTKQEKLKSLKAKLLQESTNLPLAKSANQLVFGVGNVDADIVFVGEAPGRNEDQKGAPFVGAAGKILDGMLESNGIQREDVYITNIVKYRPPANRDPSEEEKEFFWQYLTSEIEIIKPKVIVTLGRHSGEAFLPGLVISEDHGKEQTVSLKLENKETTLKILPLYHPAAAIYNRSLIETLNEDFKKVNKLTN